MLECSNNLTFRQIFVYFLGNKHLRHAKCHPVTLFFVSHANFFKIAPRVIFVYFINHVDVKVTLHTCKLKTTVGYTKTEKIATAKLYHG